MAVRIVLLVVTAVLPAACGRGDGASARPRTITVWVHAGQAAERAVIHAQVRRFHEAQDEIGVELVELPEGSYSGQLRAAALAGALPDVMELDGPFVARHAWAGHLQPIGDRLPRALRRDLLPSILAQGTFRGALYAVGTFDSGLGLYARRSALEAVGARVPEGPADAWTVDEFRAILERLAARDPDGAVLDLKLNYRGEWFAYGFAPALASAGGGLFDPGPPSRARGVLDGPESVRAMRAIGGWIADGLVDPNLDDAAFPRGRVALSWVGHWEFGRYREAAGDDLLVLPLPDFGAGTRTGQGSWCWTVPRGARDVDAAMAWIRFLLRPDEILAMTEANGAVPARRAAIARSSAYGPDGPLRLFARQLAEGRSVPRPRTPAYPAISSAFERAFHAVRTGTDAARALARAADRIEREVADNRGYPPAGEDP